jgi:hypothetical protein
VSGTLAVHVAAVHFLNQVLVADRTLYLCLRGKAERNRAAGLIQGCLKAALSASSNQNAPGDNNMDLTSTLRLMTSMLASALDAGLAEFFEAVEGRG